MRTLTRLLATALLVLGSGAALAQDRPRIIAVNHALHSITERLVGDTAEVIFPVPAGVDPSFWRPSIADISMIQSADLILLNGAGFATWVDRVSLPRARLVDTSSGLEDRFITTQSITHSHGDGGEHSHEGLASYTWLDPTLAIAQAQAVADALTSRGLAPGGDVSAALDQLTGDLQALDAQASAALAGLQDVAIITTHPRYQYLARRYDLTISALEWEAGAMPDSAQLAALEQLTAQTGARILIWEAEPPAAAFEAATGLGLQNVVFPPLSQGVDGQSFLDSFSAALSALAAATPS